MSIKFYEILFKKMWEYYVFFALLKFLQQNNLRTFEAKVYKYLWISCLNFK